MSKAAVRRHLAEAKARVAEINAEHDALIAKAKAKQQEREPFVRALERIDARRAKVPVIIDWSGGVLHVTTMAAVRAAGWRLDEAFTGKKPRQIAEAFETGAVKVSGSQMDRTAKGQVQKLRVIDKEQLRIVRRAEAATRRAEQALSRAKMAEKAAIAAAYEAGRKLTLQELVADVAKRTVAYQAVQAHDPGTRELDQAQRLVDGDWSDLQDAKTHLGHAQAVAKGDAELGACPCRRDARERKEREQQEQEADRVAALPTTMFICPIHEKRHRGPTEIIAVHESRIGDDTRKWLDEIAPGWELLKDEGSSRFYTEYALDYAYCVKAGKRMLFGSAIAKRAAAAAKAAKKPAVKVKTLAWTCPNPDCGEPNVTELEPDNTLTCESCEVAFDASTLKTWKPTPEQAAA